MTTEDKTGAPTDPVAAIKAIYHAAKPTSIEQDLRKAIALLTTIPTEEDRERVAVFMDGLSQMRSEWSEARAGARPRPGARPAQGRRPPR